MIGNTLMLFARGCLAVIFVAACTPAYAENCTFLQNGVASIYHERLDGRPTASGEALDMAAATAAHPNLEFGTRLKITDRKTGRSTYVRVNDRGPFVKNRVLDVTRGARQSLGWGKTGLHRIAIAVCK